LSLVFSSSCQIQTKDIDSLNLIYFIDSNSFEIDILTSISEFKIREICDVSNEQVELAFESELEQVFQMAQFDFSSGLTLKKALDSESNFIAIKGTAKSNSLVSMNEKFLVSFSLIERNFSHLSNFYLKVFLPSDINLDTLSIDSNLNYVEFFDLSNISFDYELLKKPVVLPSEKPIVEVVKPVGDVKPIDSSPVPKNSFFSDNFFQIVLILLIVIILVFFLIIVLVQSRPKPTEKLISKVEISPSNEDEEKVLREKGLELKRKISTIGSTFMKGQMDETTFRRLNEQYQVELNDIRVKLKDLTKK
jgi:hypothetical protein